MMPEDRTILATLRHDLRTPLNAIIGYSDLLLEEAEERGQVLTLTDLQKIKIAGETLLVLVNDSLDPSHHDTRALNLEALAAQLRQDARTPLNTIIGYSEILLEDAAADPEQSDAIPDLAKIKAAGQSFLGRINEIMKGMNGIEGDAARHGGGADTVELIRDMDSTLHALAAAPAASRTSIPSRILIVDDTPTNREVLARRLERQGHKVIETENGRVALELLKTQPVDLLLLDVMMPEMNGYEVLCQLKGDASLSDIPVLMISALDEIDSVVRCIEMGAADYLPKPFNPVLLHARIDTCLEKKRLRDQEQEYLRAVGFITDAAATVEVGAFDPEGLHSVEQRSDELGQLARVFLRMAREVELREQRLKQEIEELRIEVDTAKQARHVAEITGTEFFQDLKEKARKLRARK